MGLAEGYGTARAIALVAALAMVPAIPAAGATHGDAGVSTYPWVQDCGREAWTGFEGSYGYVDYRFCFFADAWTSTYPLDVLFGVEYPPEVYRAECPDGFAGEIVERKGTEVGLCVDVNYRVPDRPWIRVGYDISGCEVPDGRQAEDPAVVVANGGVAVCLLPVVEPGPLVPDRQVSIEPCEPQTVDPEVDVEGHGVQVCMDFHVLGIGSEDVNGLVQSTNETAHAFVNDTRTFVEDRTGHTVVEP